MPTAKNNVNGNGASPAADVSWVLFAALYAYDTHIGRNDAAFPSRAVLFPSICSVGERKIATEKENSGELMNGTRSAREKKERLAAEMLIVGKMLFAQ